MRINLLNRLPSFDRRIDRSYRGRLASIFPPRLDPQAQAVYKRMLRRLQRDMLVWLMAVGVPLSLIFVARLFQAGLVAHTMPPAAFAIQIVRVPLMVLLVYIFLRRGQVLAAWASLLIVSLSTILMLVWLLREPSLLAVGLFSLAGPALTMPLRVNALIVGILGAALFLIVRFTFPVYSDIWTNAILVMGTIVCGFAFMGAVIRRLLRQFALATIDMERQAAQRGRLEQQMLDLNQKVDHLTSLEHDLPACQLYDAHCASIEWQRAIVAGEDNQGTGIDRQCANVAGEAVALPRHQVCSPIAGNCFAPTIHCVPMMIRCVIGTQ